MMRVAIQGEPGSFSHEAALRFAPEATILHCPYSAEVFRRLMGTPCTLRWRRGPEGERELVWTVAPGHPLGPQRVHHRAEGDVLVRGGVA